MCPQLYVYAEGHTFPAVVKKKKNDPLKEKRVPEVSFLGRWDDKLRGVVRALSAPPHLTVPAFLDRRAGAEMRPMAPF